MPSPSPSDEPARSPGQKGARLLLEYAGIASRYLIVLGASAWAGLRIDRLIPGDWPILVWLLPLLCVVGLMVKAIKDTSK